MPSPIQLQRLPRRRKPANKRALLFLALLILQVCAGLTGCSAQAADSPATTAADLKRAAAGVWACPGMTAVWLDEATVQCLKDRP